MKSNYSKEYYQKNKERYKQKEKIRREADPELYRLKQRERYAKHRKERLESVHRRNLARKNEIDKIKSRQRCKKCEISDPDVLTFHHRIPKTKLFTISNGLNRNKSMDKILSEIKKCDVLCANCHIKYHTIHGYGGSHKGQKNV